MGKKFYEKTWFIILMLFLLAPVGIFLLFKYTTWNKTVKIILSVVFGMIFIVVIFSGGEKEPSKEVLDSTESIEIQEKNESIQESTPEPKLEEESADDLDYMIDVTLDVMKESFEGMGEVSFNKEQKTFILDITDEAFKNDIEFLIIGNDDAWEEWSNMVDDFKDSSKAIYEATECSITILNPENKDNMILIVMNGVVIYNVTDDLK